VKAAGSSVSVPTRGRSTGGDRAGLIDEVKSLGGQSTHPSSKSIVGDRWLPSWTILYFE